MGELVLQACGDEQGSLCSKPQWTQQGEDALADKRCQERGDAHRDQSNATKFERGEDVYEEPWSQQLKSPTFALSEAFAESRNVGRCGVLGWKGAEADFMCASSCAVSGRMASGGSVQVFLCAEQCLPLGGASMCEMWVFSLSDPQSRGVFAVYFLRKRNGSSDAPSVACE